MPAITPETAKEYQRRGAQTKRTKSANRNGIVSTVNAEADYAKHVKNHIARTQAMMDRLCVLFDDAKTSERIDVVSRAYERIFGVWAHLTLTPGVADVRLDQTKRLLKAIGPRRAMEAIASDPTMSVTLTPQEPQPIEQKESLNPQEPTVGAGTEGGGGQETGPALS